MNKAELRERIEEFAEEALHCRSNKAARELDALTEAFAKEHHCEALMKEIFIETGAGDTLADMIFNYDDSIVPTRPKF